MSQSSDQNDAPQVVQAKAAKGQPKGLWVLFITEMWERFSYYGMRALLVFYLVSKISGSNPGFEWDKDSAQQLFGIFCSLVYLTPLVGGWVADKLLGTHRSILLGGWIMAAGQALLFLTEFWGHNPEWETVWFNTAPGPFFTFMLGLILIIIGTGFFKPCVSVMVGQLYSADDPRRDSGFTIFYMGINVGAFLATTFAGLIGEAYGWYWGFGAAAVGMILGLTVYQLVRPFYLKGIGLPPHHAPEHEEGHEPTPEEIEQAKADEYERTRPLTRVDWDRMIVIVVLAVFGIVFWVAFEQAGTSLNLFAKNRTDRFVLGFEIPATWFLSINPLAIVVLAPVFAGLWGWLDKRGLQPPTPVKFAIGLGLLSLAYVPMLLGALEAGSPRPVELASTPEAIQKVLDPLQERLTQEKLEDEAKKRKEKGEEVDQSDAEPKDGEQEKAKFDLIEQLTYEGATYYAVGYEDRKAVVYEVLSDEGKLLRWQATPKENKDEEREKVEYREPQEISLNDVPKAARETLLTQAHGHEITSVESIVKDDAPAYEAKWTDGEGKVVSCVRDDGLLLTENHEAYAGIGLAGPQWLLLMYILATCGELSLSPVSLSMVTKLSPARYTAAMMGVFFATFAIANLVAGFFASFSDDIASGKWFTLWGGEVDFFLVLTIAPAIISVIVFVLSPTIKRMMHGLH